MITETLWSKNSEKSVLLGCACNAYLKEKFINIDFSFIENLTTGLACAMCTIYAHDLYGIRFFVKFLNPYFFYPAVF